MLSALTLVALGHASTWPPGSPVEQGIGVVLTQEGFEAIDELAQSFPIDPLPIDDIAVRECYGLLCWTCLEEYAFAFESGQVAIAVEHARIVPGYGTLDVDVGLTVALNDAFTTFSLYYELLCAGTTCPGWVDPFDANLSMPMALELIDDGAGGRALDVTLGDPVITYGLDNEDIHLDCSLGGFEDFLNFFGGSLYDLILDIAAPELETVILDLLPELEATVEEAFLAASIDQELDLLGAALGIALEPDGVEITPDGLVLTMQGAFDAAPADCIAAFDPGGSLRTDGDEPGVLDIPVGAHAAALVKDDLANAALYTAWRSGLLCFELGPDGAQELPIALNTSLLGLLAGDAFDELFPETRDLVIATRPAVPPEASFGGGLPIEAEIRELGLDLFAEVDGRMARIVGLSLDADAGVDLAFDGATGQLGILLDLDPAGLVARVVASELSLTPADEIEASIGGALASLVDTLIGPLLGDLAFDIPGFAGIGLSSLYTEALGADQQTLGAMATVGPVAYAGEASCAGCGGCGEDTGGGTDCSSGCEDQSCDGGCASPGARSRLFWGFVLGFGFVGVRRRGPAG